MAQAEESKVSVVLFKSENNENESDPYVEVLKKLNITASVVPVLAFNFINQHILQQSLLDVEKYSGIIFTSTRAVEAVKRAFDNLQCAELIIQWNEKQNYSVGEATSKLAKSLLNLDTSGDNTGSSEKLCNFILLSGKTLKKPLLFPCSNKRKDSIPVLLCQNSIEVCEIISYETICNPHLKDSWENHVANNGLPEVLIFFSPSGVQYSHKLIQTMYSGLIQPKCIAIGPSTAQALEEVCLKPSIVTERPNPSAVFDAMKSLM